MATVKINYATSGTITFTLGELASSTTIGRSSTSIDNGTNLYDDVLVYIAVKTSGTTLGMDKSVYVYVYGSEDGTNFDSGAEAVGSDIGITFSNPTILKGPVVLAAPGTSQTYKKVFSISPFFGGRMPRKWGLVAKNFTGQSLDPTETNFTKTYTGITYTVV